MSRFQCSCTNCREVFGILLESSHYSCVRSVPVPKKARDCVWEGDPWFVEAQPNSVSAVL
eukprot:scaffold128991_cov43-Cyclotella_meneghiniana.AAC.1